MFKDFGGVLPAPTQMVINVSHFMQSYIIYMIVARSWPRLRVQARLRHAERAARSSTRCS